MKKSDRPQTIKFRNRMTAGYKLALARRHKEAPDTRDEREEKDSLVAKWLRRHKPTKCAPAFANFVGWFEDDAKNETGPVQ